MPGKHKPIQKGLAHVVTVNMGYGHQRASHPLRHLANGDIIVANNYDGISKKDQRIWKQSRAFYEFISRFKRVPIVGKKAFDLFDSLQAIPPFYPRRDLSATPIEVRLIYRLIKKGWLKDLIDNLNRNPLPIVTTFFVPAFAADYWGYKGDIYCVVTDTDMSRSWVAEDPKKSKIKYFAPTNRVRERLMQYGVKEKNIYLTGFPLPTYNVGGKEMKTLIKDFKNRICNLDPDGNFRKKYGDSITRHLGLRTCPIKSDHPLTITFAVGGAGAQRELGIQIMQKLSKRIKNGELRMNLVAGSRNDVYIDFRDAVKRSSLSKYLGNGVDIVYDVDKNAYFNKFEETLRTTDILWTKPSELSFFVGLGIPIIMAPPIGSQEKFNQSWLDSVGAGFVQDDPEYVDEWLYDWLHSGWFAKAAMDGFVFAPKLGTYNIAEVLLHEKLDLPEPTLLY